MLLELHVENLGVIEEASLTLGEGMTVLSGETGAGKTMLVGAISMVLGGKIDPRMIRIGADSATVQARFVYKAQEYVLSRTLSASGRSRSYVNGKMASLVELVELGTTLIDLHGQHAQMRLASSGAQLSLLDEIAGTDLEGRRDVESHLRKTRSSLGDLNTAIATRERELAVIDFEVAEIAKVRITSSSEDLELEAELETLSRAEQFRDLYGEILNILVAGEGEFSFTADISTLVRKLRREPTLTDLTRRIESVSLELADIVNDVVGRLENLSADPERISSIRSRLIELRDIKRRYGSTLPEVISLMSNLEEKRSILRDQARSPEEIMTEITALESQLASINGRIRSARSTAATQICALVNERLEHLAFSAAKFDIELGSNLDGSPISFTFSPNPGQSSVEIAKFASGGELSRIMLAISLVAGTQCDTQLFDEVDSGIGGKSALDIAKALHALSLKKQVIVVTHLAQVAALARNHFIITKTSDETNTRTVIEQCFGDRRVDEIARMLSGTPSSRVARDHAAELLGTARNH